MQQNSDVRNEFQISDIYHLETLLKAKAQELQWKAVLFLKYQKKLNFLYFFFFNVIYKFNCKM